MASATTNHSEPEQDDIDVHISERTSMSSALTSVGRWDGLTWRYIDWLGS
jgi:hypothetical protein